MGSTADRRLVFGDAPERYDRYRSTYPQDVIDRLVELVGDNARVVEVGCGTGIASRLLVAAGMQGVGVEAHPEMAAVARRHLADSRWRVDVSDFEAWEPQPGDTPADLVASAQAWHWIDPPRGFRKVRQVLRPGGWMALWWNLAEPDESDLGQAILAAYAEHAPGELPTPLIEDEGSPFEAAPDGIRFVNQQEQLVRWQRRFTTTELIEHQRTHSNHMVMAPHQRERLLEAVAQIVDDHGGTYAYPVVCRLWTGQLR